MISFNFIEFYWIIFYSVVCYEIQYHSLFSNDLATITLLKLLILICFDITHHSRHRNIKHWQWIVLFPCFGQTCVMQSRQERSGKVVWYHIVLSITRTSYVMPRINLCMAENVYTVHLFLQRALDPQFTWYHLVLQEGKSFQLFRFLFDNGIKISSKFATKIIPSGIFFLFVILSWHSLL